MLPVLYNNDRMSTSNASPGNRLSSLFESFFRDDFFAPVSYRNTSAVPLSLWEDENNLYVEVDTPGMTEKDVEVTMQNGELLIHGERKCERKTNGYDTRSYGRFEQRISLPQWVKADSVEAKLRNGVLSMAFPKREEAKPHRIALQAG